MSFGSKVTVVCFPVIGVRVHHKQHYPSLLVESQTVGEGVGAVEGHSRLCFPLAKHASGVNCLIHCHWGYELGKGSHMLALDSVQCASSVVS